MMARPPFQPTAEQRRRVLVAAGAGVSQREIALALGLSRNTLAAAFWTELHTGRAVARLELLQGLYRAARGGSATAARMYLKRPPETIRA